MTLTAPAPERCLRLADFLSVHTASYDAGHERSMFAEAVAALRYMASRPEVPNDADAEGLAQTQTQLARIDAHRVKVIQENENLLAAVIALQKERTQLREQLTQAHTTLETIAKETLVRVGYCQTDIASEPALSAQEMQAAARTYLAAAHGPQDSGVTLNTTVQGISKQLELIGRGEVSVAEAQPIMKAAFSHEKLISHISAALFEATWRLISARTFDDELVDWQNLLKFVAGHFRREGNLEAAGQIKTMHEMMARAHRFAEAQPIEEVLGRKQVRSILMFLRNQDLAAGPQAILEHVKIGEANLSRVMSVLLSSGLVTRKLVGRAVYFKLTDAGMNAITNV